MLKVDKHALICDLAETYQIYDYRVVPARLLSTFAVGLGADSRIKMKIQDRRCTNEMLMQAMMVDSLRLLVWFQSEDGHKNRNRPASIVETLLEDPEVKENKKLKAFLTGADFMEYRKKLIESFDK